MGWDVLVVWQCQTRNQPKLLGKLERFFDGEAKTAS